MLCVPSAACPERYWDVLCERKSNYKAHKKVLQNSSTAEFNWLHASSISNLKAIWASLKRVASPFCRDDTLLLKDIFFYAASLQLENKMHVG